MIFQWKNEYGISIREIDEQHKKLFEIGRRISNYVFLRELSDKNEDISVIFNELKMYTDFHFKCEEKLMDEYSYPYFKTHKNEHDMLIEKIQKIEDKFSGQVQREALMELVNLVFDWISNHILISDKKIEAYLNKV
jgi:hemerythrin